MAAGWPTKVTYANGDVFNASDINDTNGTLNYINPTSATDNQVLTRDAAAGGKVKWAASATSVLTTTGDTLYASAANTLARLPVGSTGQVLTVSGGLPAWGTGGGSYTSLASGTLSGTLSLSSISGSYQNLVLRFTQAAVGTAGIIQLRVNGLTTTYDGYYVTISATPTLTRGGTTQASLGYATVNTATTPNTTDVYFYNYAGAQTKAILAYSSNAVNMGYTATVNTTGAITSITSTTSFTAGTYELFGVK